MGYDPYDGLNSHLFQSLPYLSKNRIFRLFWIQFFKKSPVNFRKLTGVRKEYNPKALALFLSGYCNLYKVEPENKYLSHIKFLIRKLIELRNQQWSGPCWGYNFDWQARAFFFKKHTPTVVVTSFVINALLDAYDLLKDPELLKISKDSCAFVLRDLNRTYDKKGNFAFSYSPLDNSVVYNASLLASRMLARVGSYTGEGNLMKEAKKSVQYCCDRQRDDGAWAYGNLPYHQWVDSFHTGYDLMCISEYMKDSGDYVYDEVLKKGLEYYVNNFFTSKGIPKYYDNMIYPIDIHAPSQLVITMSKMNLFKEQRELVEKVLSWTLDNMQAKEGYFYFQINKYFSSRIPYMRWAQAWMFYALSEYKKWTYK